MGKGSPTAEPEHVRCAARRLKTKTLSSPQLLPPSSQPTTTTTSSTSPGISQQGPSRRHTTTNKPEVQNGFVVEYSESPRNTTITPSRATKDNDAQGRPKPWALNTAYIATAAASRKQRLENVNLRGSRRPNRTSTTTAPTAAATSSSCKQSDSTTNDSQKSVLTSESLEAVPGSSSVDKKVEAEDQPDSELTEEELERRRNIEKCMSWINQLPAKFSGMHIVQERAPVMHD